MKNREVLELTRGSAMAKSIYIAPSILSADWLHEGEIQLQKLLGMTAKDVLTKRIF